MPSYLNDIKCNNRNNREIEEFNNFINKCTKQINEAEQLVENINIMLYNEQLKYKYIFGMGNNDLDLRVEEIQKIQTSAELNVLDAWVFNLPKLNSHCKNKNRKRLRNWLYKERPNKYLKHFLEIEDKIKETISDIIKLVQTGREYYQSLQDDSEKAMIERNRYIKGTYTCGPETLTELTKRVENQINSWKDFVSDYYKYSYFSEFIITIKDLMSWSSSQNSNPIINPKKQEASSHPVKHSYDYLFAINDIGDEITYEVPMSKDEILLENEANNLKKIILRHIMKQANSRVSERDCTNLISI